MEQKTNISIETDNLSLWYGKFQALYDVSSRISQNKITALIGPSGCGKTTLLRCFNRMNERFANVHINGEVKITGKNIYDPDVSLIELRKAVGMVFQRPNPMPLSIYDNVAFGLRIHTQAGRINRAQEAEAVEKALQEVFLFDQVKDHLKKRGTDLLLEQQQKLCIARLLPLKPSILLMDEPCSALDAEATEAVEDLLRTLKEKFTIVIVTHNMAQARRISDESIYMLKGQLIEHSRTAELFLTPKDKRTEEYIEGRYG
ncbi:MAG: phosphate ABC transporter ATP-binding protein [Kiritimatiellae bacterium]|nr:phosphate ABC transporter ATP-binding protein [Kiritimatiellia bacterium]MDD5521641.1 phosphate ABC transporter ATP-binding protein [Kiritimatiellia bacterium]